MFRREIREGLTEEVTSECRPKEGDGGSPEDRLGNSSLEWGNSQRKGPLSEGTWPVQGCENSERAFVVGEGGQCGE